MPTFTLVGVLEDGSVRAPTVPTNPRAPLRVTQGSSVDLIVKVVTSSGVPVDLATFMGVNGRIVLTVKRHDYGVFGTPAAIQSVGTVDPLLGPGSAKFTITPNQTRLLEPGVFAYDIWLEDGSGRREPVLPTSPFHLEPAVRVV